MGQVIATVNMKGGVGKTTLTVNIATCLAKIHRKKVLVVDLDTQISATLSMISPAEFAKCRKENRTLRNLVSQAIARYGVQVNDPEEKVYQIKDLVIPHVCKVQGLDLLDLLQNQKHVRFISFLSELKLSDEIRSQSKYISDRI